MVCMLTGLLSASPVRNGGVKGSYTKMEIFLTGCVSPRSEPPPGRAGTLHKPSGEPWPAVRAYVTSVF
jgi:hypothetical protein